MRNYVNTKKKRKRLKPLMDRLLDHFRHETLFSEPNTKQRERSWTHFARGNTKSISVKEVEGVQSRWRESQ